MEGKAINGRLSLPKLKLLILLGILRYFSPPLQGHIFILLLTCVIMGLMNFCDEYQISVLLIIPVLQVIKFMQNFDQPLKEFCY